MAFLGVRTTSILLVVLMGGCKAEQGGLGTTTGMTEGSSGAGTTEADAASSTGRGTDAGSGDTTAGSGTGASGTGPAESTTGTSGGPASESGSGSETSGSSPGEGENYGPCGPGGACIDPDAACFQEPGGDMCLPPCDGTNPSCPPPPPDNEALVECIEVLGVHCMLNCAGMAACPEGTQCENLGGGIFRCLWP